MSRFARHKDMAHRPTVVALRAAGASVEAMDLKHGPDLLVGYMGSTLLMEVKSLGLEALDKRDGKVRTREGKLSYGQVAWHAAWKGRQVLTVYGPEAALAELGLNTNKIAQLKVLTNGWKKDIATPPGQHYGKERPFRPGTDKARSLAETCKADFCTTSAVPGSVPQRCAAHAADETFAPAIIQGVDYGPPSRVVLSLGDKSVEVTGCTDEEMSEAVARLINGGKP